MQIEIIVPSLIPQSQQMGSSRGFLCHVPITSLSLLLAHVVISELRKNRNYSIDSA